MSYAIYLRKSRSDEELERLEGDTLVRHRKALLEYAARHQLPVTRIYEEVVSGDSIVSRPQMQALLSDVEKSMYKGVLVMEVERLARGDTMDQGLVAQTFKYSNTLIVTPLKTYNPNDEFDEQFFEFGLFMSRQEYRTIKRRLLRGREASAREGKFVGSVAPYGYERIKLPNQKGYSLKIVPEQAEVIRLIFDLYVNGCEDDFGQVRRLGTQQIARKLNQMGIPPHKHDYWMKETIRDMLNNPTYAGRIRWGYRRNIKSIENGKPTNSRPITYDDNCIIAEGLHEAIVPPDIFDKAQELAEERPVMPVGYKKEVKNPLAGLVICRKCGRRMSFRRSTTPGKPDYLVCHARACPNVSTPLYIVEKRVLDSIRKWIADYEFRWKKNNVNSENNKKAALTAAKNTSEKEIEIISKQLETACDLLEQQVYSIEQFLSRSAKLNERLEQSRDKINDINKQLKAAENESAIIEQFVPRAKSMLSAYDSLSTPAEKNKLLKEIVEKAVYNKDKSGAFRGVSVDDFELELFFNLPLSL